jgi:streptogramin lyase
VGLGCDSEPTDTAPEPQDTSPADTGTDDTGLIDTGTDTGDTGDTAPVDLPPSAATLRFEPAVPAPGVGFSAGTLVRVEPSGATSNIATGLGSIYGVTVGPDGMVYVTSNTITRVDPDTGEKTTIFDPDFSTRYGTAHAVNFNLDSTKMYIATIGPGTVFEMDLDANLDPTSDPTAFYTGLGAWMDGIELDECGNLYIADYSDSALWRITADGSTADMMTTPSSTDYGHGVTWGNGVGDWAADTLYLPQPYAGYHVREVRIGFASGDTVRTWNGVPASY